MHLFLGFGLVSLAEVLISYWVVRIVVGVSLCRGRRRQKAFCRDRMVFLSFCRRDGRLSMSVAGILPERNVGEYPLPDWQDASGAQHTHKGVRFLTCNVA